MRRIFPSNFWLFKDFLNKQNVLSILTISNKTEVKLQPKLSNGVLKILDLKVDWKQKYAYLDRKVIQI